jgi:hypothetical protein
MPILLRLRNLGNGKRKIFVFGAIGVAGRAKIITLSYVKILILRFSIPALKTLLDHEKLNGTQQDKVP